MSQVGFLYYYARRSFKLSELGQLRELREDFGCFICKARRRFQ